MKSVRLQLDYAGYCTGNRAHVLSGAESSRIVFQALWGLIEHNEHGLILYDTGYGRSFYEATRKFPERIYAQITPVTVTEEDTVVSKLNRHGIPASAIRTIFLTHFHADHIGGLADFPHAKVYCSARAFRQIKQLGRYSAFTKGILPDLLPADIDSRVSFIEEKGRRVQHDVFPEVYDLFHDRSILAVHLPGHARGMYGLILSTNKTEYFLIADTCWLKEGYETNTLPAWSTRIIMDSWTAMRQSLKRVHDYHIAKPETVIIPTHCSATTDPLVNNRTGEL